MEKLQNAYEILDRWVRIGLLDGLEDDKKLEMAMLFECLAQSIIDGDFYGETSNILKPGSFDAISFPILRRLFSDGKINYNFENREANKETISFFIEKLSKELLLFNKNNSEYFTKYGVYTDETITDPEAEFCVTFTENY